MPTKQARHDGTRDIVSRRVVISDKHGAMETANQLQFPYMILDNKMPHNWKIDWVSLDGSRVGSADGTCTPAVGRDRCDILNGFQNFLPT